MPEEESAKIGLEGVLEQLADYTLNTANYQTIQSAVEVEQHLKINVVEKLLSICIRGLKEDVKCTSHTLNIIFILVKKINGGQCNPAPDLVPSSLAVLQLLKTTAPFSKVEALKILCYDVIMAYPEETLINLTINHGTEILELFNSYCHQRISEDLRLKAIHLLLHLLKILSPNERQQFVREGVSIWFSKVLPTIVEYVSTQNSKVDVPIKTLEILTEDLVYVEYTDSPQWQIVLECIYTPKRYPILLKSLLEQDNSVWYKLWIIFIKLLKNQITKVNNSVGSPINALLPVVEMAFKLDPKNRCRAFWCWKTLISNFSTENTDSYINKRIKLLMIPLLSNNAKVEETALAKFDTWWHLIVEFNLKLEKISDVVLIPFIYFCFGKPHSDKPMIIPGLFSNETKTKCVEAMVEIFGHCPKCSGCVNIPKLKKKHLTEKFLINNWSVWMCAVDNVIKISAAIITKESMSRVRCVWFSLVSTIGEMKDKKLKRDFYYEVLSYLDSLALDSNSKEAEIIFLVLIPILFEKDEKINTLTTKNDINEDGKKIISTLLKLPKETLKVSYEALNNLRLVTDCILKEEISLCNMEAIIASVPSKGLLAWTVLAESICKFNHKISVEMLSKVLLCPLEQIDLVFIVSDQSLIESAWTNLYYCVRLQHSTINEDIMKVLTSYNYDKLTNHLGLTATIEIVKDKLKKEGISISQEVELLSKVTRTHYLLEWITVRNNLQILFNVVVDIVKKQLENDDIVQAENAMTLSKNLLKHSLSFKNLNEPKTLKVLVDLFQSLDLVINDQKYLLLKDTIGKELIEFGTDLIQKLDLNDIEKDIRQSITNIKLYITSLSKNINFDSDQIKFTEPESKVVHKKKKKETAIVNTVVEGGEEYVIVKSNWKFNPKKLTDNQKEKFQKKREDIPALYQDLSQSQDEFKLSTWKPDSQDTSTTNKSTSVSSSEDITTILKNLPNSDIVPKILENIQPGIGNVENRTANKGVGSEVNDIIEVNCNRANTPLKVSLTKEVKSPRIALKDRVFRNVRNLIEKTNLSSGNKSLCCGATESDPKTPIVKSCETDVVTHSAPPKISTERPSRIKRKPKKFDNLQLFAKKKRLLVAEQNNSPSDIIDLESTHSQTDKEPKISCSEGDTTIQHSSSEDNTNVSKSPKQTTVSDIKDINHKANSNEDNLKLSQNSLYCDVKNENASFQGKTVADVRIDSKNKLPNENSNNTQKNIVMVENENNSNKINSNEGEVTISTPKPNKDNEAKKCSVKKSGSKKSRIEKELAIDTVEGHPLLNNHPEKRLTRKSIINPQQTRKNLTPKINKCKNDLKSTKGDKKCKDKLPIVILECMNYEEEGSQDIIESSQDTTITTISMKSTNISKKLPVCENLLDTQELLKEDMDDSQFVETSIYDKDDTDLPINKTAIDDKNITDLTENMNDIYAKSSINTTKLLENTEFQNTANADTQLMDPILITDLDEKDNIICSKDNINSKVKIIESNENSLVACANDTTQTIENIEDVEESKSSPFKDEEQRKKDFLNNTIEISPIKILSPVGEKKSPPDETTNDYVVIKLTSAVQSNGEPFDKCDSPEIFTEDKLSPGNRDLSPPREDVVVTNTSPSSSLSLKKNRPQMRSGGRGAQMLGLCVPNHLQNVMASDTDKSIETEEKKSTPISSSARRNLRILYGAAVESDNPDDNHFSDNFLKLRRSLPATDSSPSGPILKRKLADITDEATISPASKRKRVSFHDPPVSTTVCVKKYIEPCGVRSPSNSMAKRHERQFRAQVPTKSPKRLDNLFKLDSALTKTIESFVDVNIPNTNEDTVSSSLEATTVAEIVVTNELNDTEPICADLINCSDSIEKIAQELSSPTMKSLFVKEVQGKIDTVGDLAKMTELQVNRLCIKAPKVEVARNVLSEYAQRIKNAIDEITPSVQAEMLESIVPAFNIMEVQTHDVVFDNVAIQTDIWPATSTVSTQSEAMSTLNSSSQTDESSSNTVMNITTSLPEKAECKSNISEQTDETFKKNIAESLPLNVITDVLVKKLTVTDSSYVLNRIFDQQESESKSSELGDSRLLLLQNVLCGKFESRDLILFCSELLKKVHAKIS